MLELMRLSEQLEFRLILPADGPLRQAAERLGVTVDVLPWPPAVSRVGECSKSLQPLLLGRAAVYVPSMCRSFTDLLHDICPSVVISNGIKSHILASLALLGSSLPLIWYIRDSLQERPVSRRLMRLLVQRCNAVICVSNFLRSEFRAVVGDRAPVDVIYNIVDLEQFRPNLNLPRGWTKPPGETWFGVIGALTQIKGQDLFLEAAATVGLALPGARFYLVGGNSYATETNNDFAQHLNEFVQKHELVDRVHFLGHQTEIAPILSNLDVLVQPNRGPEGLGRSVLEAMACAVPVIAVDAWGPRELISEGVTGLKFLPCDKTGLANCMLRLGTNPALRRSLGTNGAIWVKRNLCPKQLAQSFSAVINNVVPDAERPVAEKTQTFELRNLWSLGKLELH